jgi:hypothetical protein
MTNYTPPTLSASNDVAFDFEAVRKAVAALLCALPQKAKDLGYLLEQRPGAYVNLGFEYRRKARIGSLAKYEIEAQFESVRGGLIRARDVVMEATGPAVEAINAALQADPMGPLSLAEIQTQIVRFAAAISRAQAFNESRRDDPGEFANVTDDDWDDSEDEQPIPLRVANIATSDYYAVTGRAPDLNRGVGCYMFFLQDIFWSLGINLKVDDLARISVERWKTKHWGYRGA